MGKLVVTEFITVDGVIDSPGEAGWVFKFKRGDDGDKFKLDELMAADAQLLGRVTYQGFAQAWPSMGGDDFGKRMNTMPKYVVSTTLTAARASVSSARASRARSCGCWTTASRPRRRRDPDLPPGAVSTHRREGSAQVIGPARC